MRKILFNIIVPVFALSLIIGLFSILIFIFERVGGWGMSQNGGYILGQISFWSTITWVTTLAILKILL
jgi:hypothetical protein